MTIQTTRQIKVDETLYAFNEKENCCYSDHDVVVIINATGSQSGYELKILWQNVYNTGRGGVE